MKISLNCAAFNLEWMERNSEELYKMKDFYRQQGVGTRKLYYAKKSGLVIAELLSFRGWQGSVRQITGADQVIPDWFVYDTISGRAKTVINISLSLRMWEFSISGSILGPLFCF